MADDMAIKVEGVSKTFKLPHEKNNSLKSAIIHFHKRNKNYEKQEVLKDISFEIKKGEFFGIVGRNGSGKSTLLKLLAGIYSPDKGHIHVEGKLTPFIELGVGFNPELSGRDNVFLNGALLGFSRKEMESMYDEIVSFAELERFMDQKLKNYSSGMQVRLAFSIAIRANTDILVLDEVLAVGDEAFQRKCSEYFISLKDSGKSVVLVTHSMEDVRRFCSRAMLVEDGKIIELGTPEDVADSYSAQFIKKQSLITEDSSIKRYGTGTVTYNNLRYKLSKKFFTLEFNIKNNTSKNIDSIALGFDFCVDSATVLGNDTRYMDDYKSGISLSAGESKHFIIKFNNNFGNNQFTLVTNITTGMGSEVADHIRPALKFASNNTKYHSTFKVLTFPEIVTRSSYK